MRVCVFVCVFVCVRVHVRVIAQKYVVVTAISQRCAAVARGWWVVEQYIIRTVSHEGTQHPRPPEYWPDDIPELAEALLGVRTESSLRQQVLDGASSQVAGVADAAYFTELRRRIASAGKRAEPDA